MLFSITACLFYTTGASTINILSIVSIYIVSFKTFSFIILNHPSHSDSAFKLFP